MPHDAVSNLYDRLLRHLFSGDKTPGSKIIEQDLADELGVSRIPIREALRKMMGQGLLVGEEGGRGVRMRQYTIEDIRQLYEARGILEGGAARIAARAATDADVTRLNYICRQMETEIGNYGSERWANLDHGFHEALADASHNDRIAEQLKLMLTECHYIFYVRPTRSRRPIPAPEDAATHMREVLQKEHIALVDLIVAGDGDAAETKAREDMQRNALRLLELQIDLTLGA